MLDSIPNPIFVKNTVAAFTACNKAYEKAFGVDRRQFIGKTVVELDYLPKALRENLQALLADLNKLKPASAKGVYMKKITVSTTMGPGLQVDQASLGL